MRTCAKGARRPRLTAPELFQDPGEVQRAECAPADVGVDGDVDVEVTARELPHGRQHLVERGLEDVRREAVPHPLRQVVDLHGQWQNDQRPSGLGLHVWPVIVELVGEPGETGLGDQAGRPGTGRAARVGESGRRDPGDGAELVPARHTALALGLL